MDEASVGAEYKNLPPGPYNVGSAIISALQSALVRGNQIHGSGRRLLLVCEGERSLLNSVAKDIKVFPSRNWERVGRVKPGG